MKKRKGISFTAIVGTSAGIVILSLVAVNAQSNALKRGTISDIDGHIYHIVKIGNQIWTSENLKTTKLNDGALLSLETNDGEWFNRTTPAYCWYNNDTVNAATFGALYNWYAVATKKLAPKGWHIPSEADWNTLEHYVVTNGYNWDGTSGTNKIAKALAAKKMWLETAFAGAPGNDLTKNNKSGFSALPGGFRGAGGVFLQIIQCGRWWSSTSENATLAYDRYIFSNSRGYDYLIRTDSHKMCGFSVRLIKD